MEDLLKIEHKLQATLERRENALKKLNRALRRAKAKRAKFGDQTMRRAMRLQIRQAEADSGRGPNSQKKLVVDSGVNATAHGVDSLVPRLRDTTLEDKSLGDALIKH